MHKKVQLLGVTVAVAAFSSSAFAGEYQMVGTSLPQVNASCHSDSSEGTVSGMPADRDADPPIQPGNGGAQQPKKDTKQVKLEWVPGYKGDFPKPFTVTQNCTLTYDMSANMSSISGLATATAGSLNPTPSMFTPAPKRVMPTGS